MQAQAQTPQQGRMLKVEELHEALARGDRLQLVDVREPGEFASGHVPGAINIPMAEIESRLSDLDPRAPVALICHSGDRAKMTCLQIQERHPELLVVEGGTMGWIHKGYEIVRSTAASWSLERQVRFTAGLIVLVGSILALTIHPAFVWIPLAIGCGLVFAAITNFCGMGILLAKMPWNRPLPARDAGPGSQTA